MKSPRTSLILLALAVLPFAGCRTDDGGRKIPDLRETYSRSDTRPFGAYVAYREFEGMYRHFKVRTAVQPFDRTWSDINDTASVYVCITRRLLLDDAEISALLDYVDRGNDLFISAGYFDEGLLHKINLGQYTGFFSDTGRAWTLRNTSTGFLQGTYGYYYLPFSGRFILSKDPNTRILGTNDEGDINCVVHYRGRGRLFLQCDPRAFGNYFLLQKNNYRYLRNILSVTQANPEQVYWDDYYNSDNTFSSLGEILKHPPLATAFWITLVLLLLYILYGVKRRQRTIAVLRPNENTTVAFTETIGRLYLQNKDNKNIADKMITYFNEYIRNNYFLNTNLINRDFITSLGRKSGVPFGKVESLYRTIEHAHRSTEIGDYELMSLNEQIQNFYKTRN
jgi:hypothetical protein